MIGRMVLHYQLVEKLGEGGMGVVYKAEDTRLKRIVALKFLPANLSSSGEELARFQQEAEAISALNHPNIATIHDIGEVDGQKFLVLEFIGGGTLKDQIRKHKAANTEIPIRELAEYGIGIAEGLAHAHRNRIVHRDIKSDNIMLTAEGKVKITDFGLAKLRGASQLTKAGSTIGTLAYMAPEQLRGEEIDQRADLFSLGVVLYELATTRLPFRGEHEAAIMYSITNEDPVPLASVRADVPQELESIINKALQKDQSSRYQHAGEVAADLRALLGGSGPVTTRMVFVQRPGQQPAQLLAPATKKRGVLIPGLAAAAVIVLTIVAWFLFKPTSQSELHVTVQRNKSIAVLPFVNISDNKENEYFSDGVTQDIITELSKIADLKVISRTSVMQYKGTTKNVRDIAKELGVSTVLEGSVQRSGDKLRITTELIDAGTDEHLWSNIFDREMKDMFAVQDDITSHIVSALTVTLSGAEQQALTSSRTTNTKAHDLFLKGLFSYNQITKEGLNGALDYFAQAITEDSTYSEPYAGIAFTYVALADAYLPPNAAYPKAKVAALKALAIDSSNGLAQCALAVVLDQYEWKFSEADPHWARALQRAPNSSDVNVYYAMGCMIRGKTDDAIAHCDHAIALDPRAPFAVWLKGWVYYWSRQYDKVIPIHEQLMKLDPTFFYWDDYYAATLRNQGKLQESLEQYQVTQKLMPDHPLFGMALTYAKMGKKADAVKIADAIIATSKKEYIPADAVGIIYGNIVEPDKAFEYFDQAFRDRSAGLTLLNTYPDVDPLRGDPRFSQLLKKVGLNQ